MYARMVQWEGGEAEAMRSSAEAITGQAESGPPEGLPAVGFTLLIDPANGRSVGITLYETEEDMRKGDETLQAMSPPGDGMGTRGSVGFYEVAGDFRA